MRLSAYFSQPNYARHGLPICDALRSHGVGVDVWARDSGASWGPPLVEHRDQLAPLVFVASHQDAQRIHGRAVVYVEHGAGQTYCVDDERLRDGFPGGGGLDHVALFVCPSERVADRWRARYPHARAVVVGCPALDRYAEGKKGRSFPTARTVAITAHHPTFGAIPECRPALPHYDAALPHLRIDLARSGIELVGHAHPRGHLAMVRRWENLGVRFEPDPDVILSTASLLIVDNSSLAYEAAAVGVPVLLLDAPWYRRDVEHGLRFWSYVPGLQCDEPADLARLVHEALADPPEASALRQRAAAEAYCSLDGHAADRAADAILHLPQEEPMPDNPRYTDEVIDRIYMLGGTDEMVDAIRDADPDERGVEVERLRRLNDAVLAAEIAQAAQTFAVDAEVVMPTEDDLDAAAAQLLDFPADDDVLAAVGSDADLAARLFRIESATDDPSVELLERLAAIAGIDFDAPVTVEVVEPEAGPQDGGVEAPEAVVTE